MKAISCPQSVRFKIPPARRQAYWRAIWLASLTCGGVAVAQTDPNIPPPPAVLATNSIVAPPVFATPATNTATSTALPAQSITNVPPAPKVLTTNSLIAAPVITEPLPTNSVPASASTNITTLQETTVVGHLEQSRNQVATDIGASSYNMSSAQLSAGSQGDNAPFNQIILRAPGVAQDSAVNGDLHVRGEHANLQYRINGVLLPESITGFGLELDPRFVENLSFITGALPAEYGFRTAGVVDVQTKTGTFENGGEGEVYFGSHDTVRPSFELGGSSGKLNYFVDGSYEHTSLGIENTTSSHEAIHDNSDQGKLFTYLSYTLDDTSRLNFMASASGSTYQVPNVPGNNTPVFATAPTGSPQPPNLDSADLNENQDEQNYFAVLTYQKTLEDFNVQVSAIGRDSTVHFMPDQGGDLYFNGVSSDEQRKLYSGGLQLDATYNLNDQHTIRGGFMFQGETVANDNSSLAYDLDAGGMPTGVKNVVNNENLYGLFTGFYLQDAWKLTQQLTLNYGARFDIFNSGFDNENQLSPRVNLVYEPTKTTTLHAGYSRYFTPPPVESIPGNSIAAFRGTSNAAEVEQDSPVQSERADYFDVGVTQKLLPGWTVGVDSYYKKAKNELDDGLFGQTLILAAFNYSQAEIYGTEFSTSYTHGGFSTYANVAYSVAKGLGFNSSQFLFSANDLAYSQNHWIYLDHDQRVSGSFGASYLWKETSKMSTLVDIDALYGSGLRADGGGDEPGNTDPIPNGTTVPSYYSVNVGAEQQFKINKKQMFKARLDIVNITDNAYELRDGSGLGVNAPQWGARLGFFGTLSYSF